MTHHGDKNWFKRWKENGVHCRYCGKFIIDEMVTGDHMIPLSKGGSNFKENIVPCCRMCNEIKSNIPFESFIKVPKSIIKKLHGVYNSEKYIKHSEKIELNRIIIPQKFECLMNNDITVTEDYYKEHNKLKDDIVLLKDNVMIRGIYNYVLLKRMGVDLHECVVIEENPLYIEKERLIKEIENIIGYKYTKSRGYQKHVCRNTEQKFAKRRIL